MKRLLKLGALVIIISWQPAVLYAQKVTKKIQKSLAKTKVLVVDNINGSVTIQGSNNSSIEITAEKTITGDSEKEVVQGNKETSLAMFTRNDSAIVHVKNPYILYRHGSSKKRNFGGYRWDNADQKDTGYNFKFNITVKVPQNIHLVVHTINNGDISVANTQGEIVVNNINGSITLDNVVGKTKARTINGQLKAKYRQIPNANSSYYTLNGDIRVSYPQSLSAQLRFKSFNGEFYTDYPIKYQPTQVTQTASGNGKKKIYKINKYTAVKVGEGGKVFKFETFNGNIYINKQR
ncbi:DUF4097 family beta strand repeat-containing protein [uncultured Microscilla sp.]|uniref:DUF4097 family beta strand repeat-containing protein n=1 Tax=uncultured Microscilla sp. TaxID=432653 RepID=UPI00260295DC|nr:DUF4097 family beta strand repeat-containing protein [uncultured Microscilla sp.]